MSRQKDLIASWKKVSESDPSTALSSNHGRVQQQPREVSGIRKRQNRVDRLKLMHQVHEDFDSGCQIEHASHLAFAFEGLPHPVVLLGTLQAALVFEGKASCPVAIPYIYNRVIVLLVGRV